MEHRSIIFMIFRQIVRQSTSLSLLSIASASQSAAASPEVGSQTFSSRARPIAALSPNWSLLYRHTFTPAVTRSTSSVYKCPSSSYNEMSHHQTFYSCHTITRLLWMINVVAATQLRSFSYEQLLQITRRDGGNCNTLQVLSC